VLLSLALLALSAGLTYQRVQAATVTAALAGASIATAGVVLMPLAFFGDREVVASLQLGMVFVGLGALLSPPLIDVLLRGLGSRRSMAVLALVSLLPAFLVALPMPALPSHLPADAVTDLLTDTGVWLGCLAFFVYAPLEGFVSVWVSTHLTARDEPPQRTNLLLSVFWGALLFSRLALAVLLHSADLGAAAYPWLLVVPAFLVAVVLGNLSEATRSERPLAGLFFLGLFMGPIYPFLVALLFTAANGKEMPRGTAFGLLFACGSVGTLALAPLVRYCAGSRNLVAARLIPTILALILTAAALLYGLLRIP
jgi:fucose permease